MNDRMTTNPLFDPHEAKRSRHLTDSQVRRGRGGGVVSPAGGLGDTPKVRLSIVRSTQPQNNPASKRLNRSAAKDKRRRSGHIEALILSPFNL